MIHATEIKRIIREHYEDLYANKLDSLDKNGYISENTQHTKIKYWRHENMNRPILGRETESVISTLPPLLQYDQRLYKRRSVHRQRDNQVKTWGESGHLQAKERGLRRNHADNTLIRDFRPPGMWEKNESLFFKPQSVVLCTWFVTPANWNNAMSVSFLRIWGSSSVRYSGRHRSWGSLWASESQRHPSRGPCLQPGRPRQVTECTDPFSAAVVGDTWVVWGWRPGALDPHLWMTPGPGTEPQRVVSRQAEPGEGKTKFSKDQNLPAEFPRV